MQKYNIHAYRVVMVSMMILFFILAGSEAATITYTYDSKGQVIKEDYGSGTFIEYTYDAAGNRLSKVFNQNSHQLTVNSSNPGSGVTISVSPMDNNHLSTGTTSFIRTYNNGAVVNLVASNSTSGSSFSTWTGCDSVNGSQCTVTMNAARTITASYGKLLTVNSMNPSNGVAINVTPQDENGQSNGTTGFTRIYNSEPQVTLTAPSTSGANPFSRWDGCDSDNGTQCAVTMGSMKSVTAIYSNVSSITSTNVPKSIPDNNPMPGVASTLTVPTGTCTSGATDINVWIKATHPYVGDLKFTLQGNTGIPVTLLERFGPPAKFGCPGDNIDVVLDDQAAQSVAVQCNLSGTAISGTFKPAGFLSVFNGINPAGTWTLTATDNAAQDTGTLTGWGLNIGCSSAALPNYNVTLTKAGTGTVLSTPSGLTCGVSDKTCSGSFPVNSAVSLTATNGDTCPVSYTWIGACIGYSNQCDFVVTGNSNVTLETNIVNRQVKNQQTQATGTGIQTAFVNASTGHLLQAQAGVFSEKLTLSSKNLTLEGGYDCSFGSRTGTTTVKGSLTISGGSLIVDGFSLQ